MQHPLLGWKIQWRLCRFLRNEQSCDDQGVPLCEAATTESLGAPTRHQKWTQWPTCQSGCIKDFVCWHATSFIPAFGAEKGRQGQPFLTDKLCGCLQSAGIPVPIPHHCQLAANISICLDRQLKFSDFLLCWFAWHFSPCCFSSSPTFGNLPKSW